MSQEKLQVEAKDDKTAIKKARKHWQKEGRQMLDDSRINVKLKEERSGFLGIIDKDNIYEVTLEIDETAELEEELAAIEGDLELDGDFEINFAEDGVKLKITPPSEKGRAINYNEIKESLKELEIEEVDWPAIQEELEDPSEEWVNIAPRKPELDRDYSLDLSLKKDGLEAYLSYQPALGGEELTENKIEQFLQEKGIVYGIKKDKYHDLLDCEEEVSEFLIAEGKQPEPGHDGELIYHFEFDKDKVGIEREDGTIDFRNLDLINNVKKGEVLVTKKEPEPGTPGKKVTGEEISPPKPKKVELPRGKNTEVDEDKLVAKIEGQVVKERKKVSVLPIHEVQGDVDFSTGNIDFVGNVLVKGDVQEGFEVVAEGNIEIKGKVSGAHVKAGGEVIIHKGFIGKDKGQVEAKGDIKIKFVENGNVVGRSDVYVDDAIMHSKIEAGNSIFLGKGKGLIVGGKCRATKIIEAKVIGSTLATTTLVEVGIDPETKEKIANLKEELQKCQENKTKAKKALELLKKLKEQKGKLPESKELMYYRLQKTAKNMNEEIEEKEALLEELKEKSSRSREGKIKVKDRVYPGVNISIGSSKFIVHDELRTTAFVEEAGEVVQAPL